MKPKHLSMDEYNAYLRKIGLDNLKLMGEERDVIWKILQQLDPTKSYNNQRTFTDEYEYQGKTYRVHHGLEDNPVIELVQE
jgi:hypothetical protein